MQSFFIIFEYPDMSNTKQLIMEKRQFVLNFFEALSEHDSERISNSLSENVNFYFPKANPLISKDKVLRFLKILWLKFPELKFTLEKIIIEKEYCSVHWKNTGTDKNGNYYSNEGVTIIKFSDEKIVYLSDFFKNTEKF